MLRSRKLFSGLTAAVVITGICLPTQAADWYLHTGQPAGNHWNTLADWWSTRYGTTGTHPTAISSADTFHTNGYLLRTPESTVNETFGGGLVIIDGGSIMNKSKGASTVITVPRLISAGGVNRSLDHAITNSRYTLPDVSVPEYEVTSFGTGGAGKSTTVTMGTLSGNGSLSFGSAGNAYFSVTSSPQYYGTVYVRTGATLTFQSGFVSKGALYIEDGCKVVLNQSITVSKLVVGGAPNSVTGLWVGGTTVGSNSTYTQADLQTAYPAFFTGGTGSITVTQPALAADGSATVANVGVSQFGACTGGGNFWLSATPYRTGIAAIKMGTLRTNVPPSKGATVRTMDRRVAQILNTGAVPLFIQGIDTQAHDPTFMANLVDLNGNIGTGGTPATNMTYLVKRYKAAPYNLTNQVWEVGNEPDLTIDYQVTSPQEYVDFYQSCHNQLVTSGVRGNVTLCGPVVAFEYGFAANGNKTDNILNAFFTATGTPLNGWRQLDVLTRHVYVNIYNWETSPSTPDTAYNLLNAACEQVTFTHSAVPSKPYRGEYAIRNKLDSNGHPGTVGTGITEMNVPSIYRDTITQGIWFLVYDHFALYNPSNVISTGFVFDDNGGLGYYRSDGTPGYPYWATYIHGNLTGTEILSQNSSDQHLLLTASKDERYVYLRVTNRNTADITASVSLTNAPVAASTTATRFQLTSTARPDAGTATALGTSFSYTFPAMTAQIFRYLRNDAPAVVTPPAPPIDVVLDTSFDTVPTGFTTYYSGFNPVITGGNLKITSTTANMRGAAVLNGQALPASRKRMQAKFGFRIDGGHAGSGFVFAAWSGDPGVVGGAGSGLGFHTQPKVLWGVKLQDKGGQVRQVAIVPDSADPSVEGWVTQPLSDYPWGYATDMFMVVDYDGTAGTVRSRLYQGTSEAGTLTADLTNRLGNPATLPAGTVFGFTGSTTSFSENTLIQSLRITADNGPGAPPAITSASTASGTAGQSLSYQITATNTPTSYGASGLPAGLSVNTSNGVISGTPSTAGTYNATVSASNAYGTASQAVTFTISPSSGGSLPAPWVLQNIGTFTPVGTASYSGGIFSVTTGNGQNLMDGFTSDAFTFVGQTATGDCSITARVDSLTCGDAIKGEAGVMIRESSANNAPFALAGLTTGRGIQFSRRSSAGATIATTAGPSGTAPQWVRITRAGDTFTAYRSLDNITWTQVGTAQTIPMAASVTIGLALCNHGGTGNSAISSVSVTP